MPEENSDHDLQEKCNDPIAELKRSRKEALIQFRIRLENAIQGNKLVTKKKENIEIENENHKKIELWGVPLLPSLDHEGTNAILSKFLKAKDYRANEAFTLLRRTLKWRDDFNAREILEENLRIDCESYWFTNGNDKDGRPLCYNVLGKKSKREFSTPMERRKEYLRWRIQCVEKGIRNLDFLPGGVDSIFQITDLGNSPGFAMKEVKMICKKLMNLYRDHYPGIVYKNLIVNVPAWFMAIHALNLRLITQRSKNKFVFVKPSKVTETLLKYATPENILVQYGGLKRENDTEFSTNDKVLESNVRANTTDCIQIPINEVDVTVTWDVTVVGYEVTYKEEFIPEDDCSYKILLRKEKKMGQSMRNSFHIREPGKIVITIANGTYAKKKVFYRYKSMPSVPMYMVIAKS